MTTYSDLDQRIRARNGNPADSRLLGNNTKGVRNADGSIGVVLHSTEVLRFRQDGTVVLNTGGWATSTTKNRLNEFLPSPLGVVSEKGQWYVRNLRLDSKVIFFDGIVVDPESPDIAVEVEDRAARRATKIADGNQKINRDIDRFLAKHLTPENLVKVMADTTGDCWACKGILGENDHLWQHLREGYLQGSMLFNAIKEKGYRHPEVIYSSIYRHAQQGDLGDSKRLLRDYLRRHLLKGAVMGLKPTGS